MSDRLHDHLTLGYRPGCAACEQALADLEAHPDCNDVDLLLVVAV
jgi:hypothetical protein